MAVSGGGQKMVVVVVVLQRCPRSVNLEPSAWHGRAASARGLSILLASGVPRALGLLKPAAANTGERPAVSACGHPCSALSLGLR